MLSSFSLYTVVFVFGEYLYLYQRNEETECEQTPHPCQARSLSQEESDTWSILGIVPLVTWLEDSSR